MIKKAIVIMIFILIFSVLIGCGIGVNNKNIHGNQDIEKTIITSIPPLYSMTENIVGNKFKVINMIQPGVSEHDIQLTPSMMKNIENSSMIIINGAGLEGEIINGIIRSNKGKPLIDTSSGVNFIKYDNGFTDPHIWLDTDNAKIQVMNIYRGIIDLDPANKDFYEANLNKYIQKLDKTHENIKQKLLSAKIGDFILFHDAFNYYLSQNKLLRYKKNIIQDSPGVNPSSEKMRQIADDLKSQNIKVIFTEPQFDSKIVQILKTDYKVKTTEIDPIGLEFGKDGYINLLNNITNQFTDAFIE